MKYLNDLFTLCSTPNYVHSDNPKSFISGELKAYFTKLGIATSHSSIYHPTGNSQVERFNGMIRHSVRLALRSKNYPVEKWECVLPNVLHAL